MEYLGLTFLISCMLFMVILKKARVYSDKENEIFENELKDFCMKKTIKKVDVLFKAGEIEKILKIKDSVSEATKAGVPIELIHFDNRQIIEHIDNLLKN